MTEYQTANQIFTNVIALMFAEESDKADYRANFLANLNMKLEETFSCNNSIRLKKGLDPLGAPPFISDLERPVEYEFEVTRSLLPLGIAGDLYVDDDETGISNDYRERYRAGIANKTVARWCDVKEEGYGNNKA